MVICTCGRAALPGSPICARCELAAKLSSEQLIEFARSLGFQVVPALETRTLVTELKRRGFEVQPCRTCSGSGKVECPTCHGAGRNEL